MTSIKKYTAIFGVLMVFSTVQFGFEASGLIKEMYLPILVVIMALSTIKALAVSGYYMHLVDEPRAVTYIAVAGTVGVIALTAGAAYSIT